MAGMCFRTTDGYILRHVGGQWTDGDMAFLSGKDGLPVDVDGIPLEGERVQEDPLRPFCCGCHKPIPFGQDVVEIVETGERACEACHASWGGE